MGDGIAIVIGKPEASVPFATTVAPSVTVTVTVLATFVLTVYVTDDIVGVMRVPARPGRMCTADETDSAHTCS